MSWQDDRQLLRQRRALANCRDVGLFVKAGIVVGHFGATEPEIESQVLAATTICREFSDIILPVDVEILSPEPGSRDFLRLTDRKVALDDAERLGLKALFERLLNGASSEPYYQGRSSAILRYVSQLMLDVSVDLLLDARQRIRDAARGLNIYVAS